MALAMLSRSRGLGGSRFLGIGGFRHCGRRAGTQALGVDAGSRTPRIKSGASGMTVGVVGPLLRLAFGRWVEPG